MDDKLQFALPHINNLQTYAPGKPIETLAREKNLTKIIKLASNENPFGPSPTVLDNINKNSSEINLYPDPDQHSLKQALSNLYTIKPDMLAIGNGSDEVLQMIMRAFISPSNNIIFPKYSFMSYQICASAIGAKCIVSDVDGNWQNDLNSILNKIDRKTKLICIANPNNPTGTYLDLDIIDQFLDNLNNSHNGSNILVLLDEAYFEYIKYNNPDTYPKNYTDQSIELLNKYHNLIITRSFSKAYGLAGLRVGYSIASPTITSIINKIKQPFNVNRIAQCAATTAIADQNHVKNIVAINCQQQDYLYTEFDKLDIKYIKSETNFITISIQNSQDLYNYLLNYGIIVRPISNYGLDNYLRISIGKPEENKLLIKALNEYNIA